MFLRLKTFGVNQEHVRNYQNCKSRRGAGCSGVKFYWKAYSELKRMYLRLVYQGQGQGQMTLAHLEDHAHSLGIPIM